MSFSLDYEFFFLCIVIKFISERSLGVSSSDYKRDYLCHSSYACRYHFGERFGRELLFCQR